jgi:hypothetical protein
VTSARRGRNADEFKDAVIARLHLGVAAADLRVYRAMNGADEVVSPDDLETATRGAEVAAWKAVPDYVIVEPIAASPDYAVVVGPAAAGSALPADRAGVAAAAVPAVVEVIADTKAYSIYQRRRTALLGRDAAFTTFTKYTSEIVKYPNGDVWERSSEVGRRSTLLGTAGVAGIGKTSLLDALSTKTDWPSLFVTFNGEHRQLAGDSDSDAMFCTALVQQNLSFAGQSGPCSSSLHTAKTTDVAAVLQAFRARLGVVRSTPLLVCVD